MICKKCLEKELKNIPEFIKQEFKAGNFDQVFLWWITEKIIWKVLH